jgi:hypothetical protein
MGGRWSKQEDARLRETVEQHGAKNWKTISQIAFRGGRSDVQCLHRWQKVLRPGLVKGAWTKEEDAIVFEMVTLHGVGNIKWSVIAAELPGRLGKQARERWYNHLDPGLNKGPWTEAEDTLIMGMQADMGNRWCEIAKHLTVSGKEGPGRRGRVCGVGRGQTQMASGVVRGRSGCRVCTRVGR